MVGKESFSWIGNSRKMQKPAPITNQDGRMILTSLFPMALSYA